MRPRGARLLAAAVVAFLPSLVPALLAGQAPGLQVDAGGSYALPPAGSPRDPAPYASLGLSLLSPTPSGAGAAWFASARGGLGASDDVADWGALGVGAYFAGPGAGLARLSATALASAFVLGDPDPYRAVSASLTPQLALQRGLSSLAIRAQGGVGRSRVVSEGEDVLTDLWSWGGGVELARRRLDGGLVRAGAEGFRSAGGDYRSAYAGAQAPLGRATVRGELRAWGVPGGETPVTGTLSLSLPVGPRLSAQAAGGRSDPDPLLGSPAASYLAGGVTWTPVRARGPGPATPVALVDRSRGAVRFQVREPEAADVSVLGDFSAWEAVPLARRRGGWAVELELEPGVYHFGFLVDGRWHVPEGTPGRGTDEWGRPTAILVVPSR